MKHKTIIFFSSGYPYETTLYNEFKVLSDTFDTVYYFPSSIKEEIDPTIFPNDVVIKDDLTKEQQLSLSDYFQVFFIFFSELFKKGNFFVYLLNAKDYLHIAKKNIRYTKALIPFIEENQLKNAIFYDYWFENVTLSLAFLKKNGYIKHFVSRAHGFDIYDERWPGSIKVPYRNLKAKMIDTVFACSANGQNYIKSKITEKYQDKIKLSYLGISIPEYPNLIINEKAFTLVSASHTKDFKRVHLIPDLLKHSKFPIHWIHFGEGPNDKIILEKTKSLPSHIQVSIKGNVPNSEVLEFYQNNYVDGFISLSETEGLPISMMEVVARGIPIFACAVGGIPEIVNEITGQLFSLEDKIQEISRKFNAFCSKQFSRMDIYQYAKDKFDYQKNYSNLYTEFNKLK